MKKYLILLLIIGSFKSLSQQQALFTQYMFNQLALNPAYAGIHEGVSASFLWREQWVGFEGAPRTQTFSLHSPIGFRPISLGLMVLRDEIGLTTNNNINFSYAYRIRLGRSIFSFGLQGGMNHFRADLNPDGIIDPSLNSINEINPNFGSGLMWHSDKFYLGVSLPQLLNQKIDANNPESNSEIIRHYYILGGYVFPIHENILLKPNFMIKSVKGAPIQVDLNLNMLLQNLIWVGVSYRSFESVSGLVQIQLNPQFQLGYSYDFAATSRLAQTNSGSHEIMINYIFALPRTKILTPRYF